MNNLYQPLISNISSSTLMSAVVFTGKGYLHNIIVNNNNGGVISIGNGTLAVLGSLVHSSITIATGERLIQFFGEPFETGLLVNLTGTANITVQYRKNS
jgi:hypothetical protein